MERYLHGADVDVFEQTADYRGRPVVLRHYDGGASSCPTFHVLGYLVGPFQKQIQVRGRDLESTAVEPIVDKQEREGLTAFVRGMGYGYPCFDFDFERWNKSAFESFGFLSEDAA